MSERNRDDRSGSDNDLLNMLNTWGAESAAEDSREASADSESEAQLLGGRTGKRRRKRAKTGKRSNPDWTLASCYVEKHVYWAVREGLAAKQRELGRKVDYSELVNSLLKEWCDEQGVDIGEAGDSRH